MNATSPSAVLLIGIPASGKSTFCYQRFFDSHVRINRDQLKTRHREVLLLAACLQGRQSFVVDNTNFSKESRARFIAPARAAGFRVVGYYFDTRVADALARNRQRTGRGRIPDQGVLGIARRLEPPTRDEGFDELWRVSLDGTGGFAVDEERWDSARSGDEGAAGPGLD